MSLATIAHPLKKLHQKYRTILFCLNQSRGNETAFYNLIYSKNSGVATGTGPLSGIVYPPQKMNYM